MITEKNFKPYKTPEPGVFNLRAGALSSREDVLIVAGLARLDAEHTAHSIALKWSGTLPWHGFALEWSAASCCTVTDARRVFCILGINGEFGVVHGNEISEGDIGETSMYAVNAVGRSTYAVGTVGKVLRSEDCRSWNRLNHAKTVNNNLLQAIAAYTPDEVYAVGAKGTIVLLRPTKAERIDSPTNLVLSGICRGPDGLLYACGQKGVVLRGREHKWTVIDHGVTNEDLWDIRAFQGRVFLTSTHFLYELNGNSLETVRIEHDPPRTLCKLTSAGDDTLLSVGQRDAFLFDGREWTRLI
jgi:hypothetical protein